MELRTQPRGGHVEDLGCGQHAVHQIGFHVPIFDRQGVDRGGDHDQASAVDPVRRVAGPREDHGCRRLDVGTQEIPRLLGVLVVLVDAHMAAPDHEAAGLQQRRHQSGGLRVVQQDDVAGADAGAQLLRVAGAHPVIDVLLLGAERAAVPGRTVQLVVQPLGQHEEVRLAGDDGPPPVHPRRLHVGEVD
jgi:hypothetical protein